MIRKLTLWILVAVIAVGSADISTAKNKHPRNENCHWEYRSSNLLDWLRGYKKKHKNKVWVCANSDSQGRAASARGSSQGLPRGSSGTTTETGKTKGNNGIGNGLDPQPPGNPKPNDTNL